MMKTPLLTAVLVLGSLHLGAETISPKSWPKTYETDSHQVALYQPQIQEWRDFKHCEVALAIGIKDKASDKQTFGAMILQAPTVTDTEERVVHFGDRTVVGIRFPEAKDKADADLLEGVVRSILTPSKPLQTSLDDMLANVDRSEIQKRDIKANLAPPPIFYASKPTILVMFLGEPKFEVIPEVPTMLTAVNTNWDLFMDPTSTTYFLLANDVWLTTGDLEKGKWTALSGAPTSLQKLPDNENWGAVRSKLRASPAEGFSPPAVIVSKQPAELILTDGMAQLALIPQTSILYVTNTESDLFLHGPTRTYYYLAAGRWFKATTPDGPWKAATLSLPSDFADIPEDHEKAHVLSSVPGTAAADEAVILASIPKTATVRRSDIIFAVKYDGEPEFVDIPGTSVKYAVNTSYDVFMVGSKFYACHEGIWFESTRAKGPWEACDEVPDAIYDIPADSPKHHVTYVHVYESTPTTVQVGYTSGYSGAIITNGLVMFGLGYWIGHDHHHHYWYRYPPHVHYYAYGCGAYYNPYYGVYHRSGHVHYGPHGGAGGQAVYNPWTGGYARGGYRYGPNGVAYAREAYNPWTDTYAARVGAGNAYASWGRSVVVRDDEWMRTRHASNWRGTVAGGRTSKGGAALLIDRKTGPDGGAVKTRHNDVYVGRDGNIYKRDKDGNWSKRNGGSWENVEVPREAARNWSEKSALKDRANRSQQKPFTSPLPKTSPPSLSREEVERRRQQLQQRQGDRQIQLPQRSSYQPTQRKITPRQLDWDSRSRDRSSFQRRSTSGSSFQRSSGFSRGTGGFQRSSGSFRGFRR